MNDFERRYLDILQRTDYISSVARPGKQIVNIDYFAYTLRIGTDAVPIANNTTAQGTIEMQSDSDFVLSYISGGCQSAVNGPMQTNLSVLLQMQDTGSGKTYFNTPTLMPLVCGAGGFPFLLPAPRVLNPNTNLLISASNITGANVFGVYIVLHGARIFYAS
jgi:hypothetical protein